MSNLIFIKTIYAGIVIFCSLLIFLMTRRLYIFSRHKDLGYYSSAFFYLALGFSFRYGIILNKSLNGQQGVIDNFGITTFLMELFLVMPGILFLYSIIWRKIENGEKTKADSILLIFGAIIALADTLTKSFIFMYTSQSIIFLILSVIILQKNNKSKNPFLQIFNISIFLFFFVWLFNFIAQYVIPTMPVFRLYAYILTILSCLILLYTNIQLMSRKEREIVNFSR